MIIFLLIYRTNVLLKNLEVLQIQENINIKIQCFTKNRFTIETNNIFFYKYIDKFYMFLYYSIRNEWRG